MFADCDRFGPARAITTKREFDELHERLTCDGLHAGVLKIIVGSLQRNDEIDCLLECATCGTRVHLICETYHGIGGSFERIANDRQSEHD
jgi:hypothetical protein